MKAEIIAIVDESGSMGSIAQEATSGFDKFIAEQRRLPGQARLTLVKFQTNVIPVYAGRDIHSVPPLQGNFFPGGMTALNDAVGMTLARESNRIAHEGWADQIIVVILTDGQENQSREYSQESAGRAIAAAQGRGWQFVFLAANQDAFATARQYGINEKYVASFAADGAGTRSAMSYVSAATSAIRGTTF